jgi:hypothetical protein
LRFSLDYFYRVEYQFILGHGGCNCPHPTKKVIIMKSPPYRFCNALSRLGGTILVLTLCLSAGSGAIFGVRFAAAQSGQDAIAARIVNQRIREAIAVQDRHTEQVIRIPGVVGIGTGIGANDQPVIRVFSRVSGIAGIPKTLDGIPVTVKVTGMFIAYSDPRDRFKREKRQILNSE